MGRTNAYGSKNPDYCSYCFQNGAFTSPEIKTAADIQEFCIGKYKEYLFHLLLWRSAKFTRVCSGKLSHSSTTQTDGQYPLTPPNYMKYTQPRGGLLG